MIMTSKELRRFFKDQTIGINSGAKGRKISLCAAKRERNDVPFSDVKDAFATIGMVPASIRRSHVILRKGVRA